MTCQSDSQGAVRTPVSAAPYLELIYDNNGAQIYRLRSPVATLR